MQEVSDKLDWTLSSIRFITPEIIISFGILVLIVVGLITDSKIWARLLTFILLATSTISLFLSHSISEHVNLFGGMLRSDSFSFYLRGLIGIASILVVMLSQFRFISKHSFEYFTMILSITLGAQLLVMTQHFVMMIICMELMSIPAYILAGFTFNRSSAEATMKYFVYGSVATAFLIFGISWIYGFSDTLHFASESFAQKLKFHDNEVFLSGGLLVIAGLLFKMAATPFHFWAPDIYQTAPMPIIALFSTVPKIAAAAVVIKLVSAFGLSGGTRYDWQTIIAIASILTLSVGNFSALLQKNVKRLMAYSSIGQAGFLLIASATLTNSGTQFFLFYCSILVVSTVLAFLTLNYFEFLFKAVSVHDFSGIGRQLPEMSALLTLAMLSLVGLPITAGFTAKLFIFTSLLEAWSSTGKIILLWLFAFGLLNTVVSLYYYLRIPYYLFLKRGPQKQSNEERPLLPILFGVFLGFILLWLFFQPDSLMGWINRINFELR